MIFIPTPSPIPGEIGIDTSNSTVAKGWLIAMAALLVIAWLGSRGVGGKHEK